jgi:hypothetical protein
VLEPTVTVVAEALEVSFAGSTEIGGVGNREDVAGIVVRVGQLLKFVVVAGGRDARHAEPARAGFVLVRKDDVFGIRFLRAQL